MYNAGSSARHFHLKMTNDSASLPLQSIPADIHCAQDYELLAQRHIAHPAYEYIAGGAAMDMTLAANRAAFARWSIYPRLLRKVDDGHTRTQLNGMGLAHPIMLAPVALQRLVHPNGELDTARGANAMDACMISSTLSTFTLEDIAHSSGSLRWFQLYLQPQRAATLALIRRAETAGFGALVITLDAAIQVASARALRAKFSMPADCWPANLAQGGQPAAPALAPGASRVLQGQMRFAVTPEDLDWIVSQTSLPVWVKGVLHPDDACALRERGVAGVVVSNHGGRSLDGAPASLDALPAIRAAVGADYPLMLDSGVRSGADVFKALALGADAVAVGRLQVYALAVAGALGVAHMLKLLREELEVCMAMSGCATIAQISPAALCQAPGFPQTR